METSSVLLNLLAAFAIGYLPGAVLGFLIWIIAKRSAAMPLFRADIISFAVPLIVWLIMYKYNWSFARKAHNDLHELVLLGWIWSLCVIARLLIPRFTHKIRFRLAAINTGSVALLAAVVLALFFQGFGK
ncbi:MAG: hypothetical protein J6Q81_05510 [Lentisphaeria bacterium]|nr:hypothetical protein [Lentisphaeria bacterium]